MSLLVVGSVALDSLETPFGHREEVLGGSASYFSTAACFFAPARVVAVVGEDFPEAHLDFLASRGVDLGRAGPRARAGPSAGRAATASTSTPPRRSTPSSTSSPTSSPSCPRPTATPSSSSSATSTRTSSGRCSIRCARPARGLRHHELLDHRASARACEKTLTRVDLLFVNDAEARQLSGEHNVVKAARAHPRHGPAGRGHQARRVRRALFSGREVFAASAFPLADVFDPTGAGDTFAGGFMGYLARCRRRVAARLRRAMVMGSVMACFAVEQFSLDRLRTLTARRDPRALRRGPAARPLRRPGAGRPCGQSVDPGLRRGYHPATRGRHADRHPQRHPLQHRGAHRGARGRRPGAPDRIVCLGDVVGYGASANECCDLVRQRAEVTLLGNHDAAVRRPDGLLLLLRRRPPRARLDRRPRSSAENLAWLRGLPYTYRDRRRRLLPRLADRAARPTSTSSRSSRPAS